MDSALFVPPLNAEYGAAGPPPLPHLVPSVFFSKDNNGNILRETAANAGDADFCNANTQQSTRVLSSVITIRRGAPHTRQTNGRFMRRLLLCCSLETKKRKAGLFDLIHKAISR